MNWIDKIPLAVLIVIAIMLGIAPITGEPHLLEKSKMLIDGTLVKPIDIFDLFMHGTPALLLVIRLSRMMIKTTDKSE